MTRLLKSLLLAAVLALPALADNSTYASGPLDTTLTTSAVTAQMPSGISTCTVLLTGTLATTANLSFEQSLDNKLITDGTKSWRAWSLVRDDGVVGATTGAALTPPRNFVGSCAATRHVRVRVGVAGTGSPVININGSSGVGPSITGGPSGSTTGVVIVDPTTPANGAQVGANDTNAIGNGLTALPAVARASPTATTAGRAEALQVSTTTGALYTQIAGNSTVVNAATNDGAAALTGLQVLPAIASATPQALTAARAEMIPVSTRGNIFTEGQVATNTAAAGNPFTIGSLSTADGSTPTPVTATNTGYTRMSTEGRQFVQTDHPNRFKCVLAMTTATTTECQAAPSASFSLYITDVIIGESGTAATQTVKLVRGTGTNCGTGTADLTMPFGLAAAFATVPMQFVTPIKNTTVNALCVTTSAAVNATNIEVHGYTAP